MQHADNSARSAATKNFARQLRSDMSLPEVLLWQQLRRGRLDDFRFRRQHPLGPYVADFFCHEAALVVEIDGSTHGGERLEKDRRRDEWMAEQGLFVLRLMASFVLEDMENARRTIRRVARERAGR